MQDVSLIIYSATDMTAAKRFFRELTGGDPYVDSPQYTGYKNGSVEIGLVPKRGNGASGGLAYWDVEDIAASLKALTDAGGTIEQDVTDVGYGLLVASVREPSGAVVGLRQKPPSMSP